MNKLWFKLFLGIMQIILVILTIAIYFFAPEGSFKSIFLNFVTVLFFSYIIFITVWYFLAKSEEKQMIINCKELRKRFLSLDRNKLDIKQQEFLNKYLEILENLDTEKKVSITDYRQLIRGYELLSWEKVVTNIK